MFDVPMHAQSSLFASPPWEQDVGVTPTLQSTTRLTDIDFPNPSPLTSLVRCVHHTSFAQPHPAVLDFQETWKLGRLRTPHGHIHYVQSSEPPVTRALPKLLQATSPKCSPDWFDTVDFVRFILSVHDSRVSLSQGHVDRVFSVGVLPDKIWRSNPGCLNPHSQYRLIAPSSSVLVQTPSAQSRG